MSATILLMHGYIGFGKTTVAKKFVELGYTWYNHDEFTCKMFGDHPSNEDFMAQYDTVYNTIIDLAYKDVTQHKNIILDFGFWSKKDREKILNIINNWKLDFKPSIIWVNVKCPIDIARQRCINRDKNRKSGELWVPLEVFDGKLSQFEPIDDSVPNQIIINN